MNEHQVSIGESTCPSRLYTGPVGYGGKALLEVSELSQIALERTTTAREAIQLMGDLAMEYGYYSGEWNTDPDNWSGEGGEALTVADPEEVWMFHILPDDTGTQAVWVAQRVPHGHVTVASNMFIIGDVIPGSKDFMYSDNLWDVAQRNGWWFPSSPTSLPSASPYVPPAPEATNTTDDAIPNTGNTNISFATVGMVEMETPLISQYLHFTKVYGVERRQPIYANLRRWRVLSNAAPSLNLPAETDAWASDYPFSVEAEEKFTPQRLMALLGDHYDGTKYDTAKGMAGGPYGDPNR
jgi:dipeptidase